MTLLFICNYEIVLVKRISFTKQYTSNNTNMGPNIKPPLTRSFDYRISRAMNSNPDLAAC